MFSSVGIDILLFCDWEGKTRTESGRAGVRLRQGSDGGRALSRATVLIPGTRAAEPEQHRAPRESSA